MNSIEEDIERLKLCSTNQCYICGRYEKEECMLERNRCEQHILSDYKRVLKENEELKATRKLNGIDKNVGSIEEDIKILEVENYYLEELGYLRENNHFIKFNQALKNLIKAYKELKEENKELISDNLDYQRTLDIFDKRTYRKKYLEERRKEEPNLLYPDADEIYKRYYKLREENKELKKDNKLEGINDEI